MENTVRRLFLEITAIVLVAAVAGLIWNHRMLYGVWSGRLGSAPSSSFASQDKIHIPPPAGLMQVKELFDRKEAVFVDARDELSFVRGHIKGAVPLPIGQFDARSADFTGKVPFTSSIVVYCNGYGCHDSLVLGEKLMSRGYRQVFVYEGGYPEWKDARLPVEGQNP